MRCSCLVYVALNGSYHAMLVAQKHGRTTNQQVVHAGWLQRSDVASAVVVNGLVSYKDTASFPALANMLFLPHLQLSPEQIIFH